MSEVPPQPEPGRRSLMAMLAAFAALAALVVTISLVAGLWKARPPAADMAGVAPEVTAFLGPLATGAAFDGVRVTRIHPASQGRITLDLTEPGGQRFVVDVHARAPGAPPGLAETADLSIYLRTEQRGAPTPEAAMRACNALAAALRAREESGHPPPPLSGLQ